MVKGKILKSIASVSVMVMLGSQISVLAAEPVFVDMSYSVTNADSQSEPDYMIRVISSKAFADNKHLKVVKLGSDLRKIKPRAFDGCKNLKTLIIRSKKLTKSSVRGALKGSSVERIFVPDSKVKDYEKIFTKKNCGRDVKVRPISDI